MRVHLVRHGATSWNELGRIQGSSDIGLSETGFAQAKHLAVSLNEQDVRPTKVYTSKLRRALETGNVVADALDIPLVAIDGLEEINLGDWEGLNWDQVTDRYPREYAAWTTDRKNCAPPNGETHGQLVERVVPALKAIVDDNDDNDILVVMHGFGITCVRCLVNDRDVNDLKEHRIANGQVVTFDEDQIRQAALLLSRS